jgi:hypothetical protein
LIAGTTNVCPVMGLDTALMYSVATVPNASEYDWDVPTGAAIVSGQGTNTVWVKFNNNFTSGSLSVIAQSNCGNSNPSLLTLQRLIPGTPTAISGPVNVCSFVGTGLQATYSIAPVANATSYLWNVPNNVTLVSGQGTNSIVVLFSSNFRTSAIKVKAVNNCYMSANAQLTATSAVLTAPGAISGPQNICSYLNNPTVAATYIINKVPYVTSYLWTVPAGATILSHPAGLGENDTIINVIYGAGILPGSSIQVQSAGCGLSSPSSFSINTDLPIITSDINGPANVCGFVSSDLNPSGTIATYFINKAPNATSYSWVLPNNALLVSHPAGSGVNDTVITVRFTSDFTSGSIVVRALNSCGNSVPKTLDLVLQVAQTPGSISVEQTSFCPKRIFVYSIAEMPLNADGLIWSIPRGAEILSGDGTTSITVLYDPGYIEGEVSVQAFNNCSLSELSAVEVILQDCDPVPDPTGQLGLFTKSTKEKSNNELIVYPNPSTSSFNLKLDGVKPGAETTKVMVYDMRGRLVKSMTMLANERKSFGNDLKAGTYLIKVLQGSKIFTDKVIKL